MMVIPLTSELYRFTGRNKTWHFTSDEQDIEWNGDTYEAAPLGRSEPEASQDITQAGIEVFLPRDNEVASELLRYIGDDIVSLDVFRYDHDAEDYGVFWKGRIVDIQTEGDEVRLTAESFFTSLRRSGLRARFSKICRHNVYGEDGCRADPNDHVETLVWTNYENKIITVPDAADFDSGWFTGGKIVTQDGAEGYIIRHSGSALELTRHLDFFAQTEAGYGNSYGEYYDGSTVDVYPGCNKTLSQCRDKFDNTDNFGGFPWIPSKNPFGGSSIV